MLTRLSKNSFVRIYDEGKIGYITNQLTYHDRTYDENGAVFLSQLSRQPKDVQDIVDSLCGIYEGVGREIIERDFIDFVLDLSASKFIVVGNDAQEMDSNDPSFSYQMDNPKTLVEDHSQLTREQPGRTTQDFLLKHDADKPRLAGLQFELTSRCNERCIHCYIPNGKKNAGFDLSFDKFKFILDQFVEMGGIHVTLSGGEALMNKDIIKILYYCREKDLQTTLLTNLISLKEEHIAALKDVNVSLIQVSLYSMDPEIHDTITTIKGSFEKTISAIERLHSADIPVQISCPVMKANKTGYDKVMQYARKLKMKAQTDYIMMAQADFNTQNLANRLNLDETESVIRDILENDVDYKTTTLDQDSISSIPLSELAEMPICGAGVNDLCVTVTGDIYPCAGWQEYVVGNVFQQRLKDIWDNSQKLKDIRRIRKKDFPKCLHCEAKDYCSMCLVRNYNESGGDMFKINQHFCDVAFLNKRLVEEYRSKGLI